MDGKPKSNAASYYLYNNQLDLGDNTVQLELDDVKMTILNHSVINIIYTQDENFNNYKYEVLQNLLKKSTSLSVSSEKERTQFFNQIKNKIKLTSRL